MSLFDHSLHLKKEVLFKWSDYHANLSFQATIYVIEM